MTEHLQIFSATFPLSRFEALVSAHLLLSVCIDERPRQPLGGSSAEAQERKDVRIGGCKAWPRETEVWNAMLVSMQKTCFYSGVYQHCL